MPTLLADLRGPQLSILVALWLAHTRGQHSLSNRELGDETGYNDHKTITSALLKLSRRALVICVGNPAHRNQWSLTATCRQMFLPAIAPPLNECGENPHSHGGSSSLDESPQENPYLPPLLLPRESGGNPHSLRAYPQANAGYPQTYPQALTERPQTYPHAELAHVVALLIAPLKALGCPEDRAIAAVTRALSRGESAQALAEKIVLGRAYVQCPSGRAIRLPGHFLAACLLDGRAIPQPPAAVDLEDVTRYDGYLPFADNAPDADHDAAADPPDA